MSKLSSTRERSTNSPARSSHGLTGNLFGAGSDTSSSTLVTFVLACCAFPEAMEKAQAELDAVVGAGRSPYFDDQPNLPYVNAFVKEVLRWRSVAIIGGQPHSPTQDDSYNGWLIPLWLLDPGQCGLSTTMSGISRAGPLPAREVLGGQ